MFSKTVLKTNSLGRNVRAFIRRLCKFSSLYWYDTMCTADASSWSSSVVSRSFTRASTFSFPGISARMMGISTSMGMMASIP